MVHFIRDGYGAAEDHATTVKGLLEVEGLKAGDPFRGECRVIQERSSQQLLYISDCDSRRVANAEAVVPHHRHASLYGDSCRSAHPTIVPISLRDTTLEKINLGVFRA